MSAPPGGFGINHIALVAREVAKLADFYERVLGLTRVREQPSTLAVAAGTSGAPLDSVWLRIHPDLPAILMIERANREGPGQYAPEPAEPVGFLVKSPGYHMLCLSIAPGERAAWSDRLATAGVAIENQTEYTLYFRDAEGNRVGLSHFPEAAL
jgi:catechol 2,3-dioxygenase-like lactoylglutathione lyase family enzyme